MKRRETGSHGKKIAFRQVIVSPVGSLSSHLAVCVPVTIASSTTPRRISNAGDDELVLLVIGGKDGYVERDGHVMSDEDLELRINLGKEQS